MKRIRRKCTLLLSIGLLSLSTYTHGQYCIPTSLSGCVDGDQINTFMLTGENGTSLNNPNTGCAPGAYADLTTLPAVSLGQGITYTATISSVFYDPSGDGDFCAIWIDLNNNGTFEALEKVGGTDTFISNLGSPVSIAIPAAASLGNRRMRVVVAFGVPYEDMDPCNLGSNIWNFGEAHDYTVNIIPPPPCITPTALAATAQTNAITASWTGSGSYILEYGPQGFTPGTGATAGVNGTIINNAVSPQTVSGLSSGAIYHVYVRQNCTAAGNGFSINASTVITTLGPPANDECANALDISNGYTFSGFNTSATQSLAAGGCGSPFSGGAANDVWYKLTTPIFGDVTLTQTLNTIEDLVLEVRLGDCASSFGLACDGNAWLNGVNEVTFTAAGGATYYVRSYGYDGTEEANFTIAITGTPLPATMNQLSGKLGAGNQSQLSWNTFTEQNNKGFEIQRSADGRSFTATGWVNSKATNGNSARELAYDYLDRNPVNGKAFYRLMQVDHDGKSTYSNIVSLTGKNEGVFTVAAAPNPVSNSLVVSIFGKQGANGAICITDMTGKIVRTQAVTGSETTVDMKGLVQGLYLVKYTDTEHTQTIKVSKQ